MERYLHQLSGLLFYLLGTLFLLMYLCHANGWLGTTPMNFFEVFDLAFMFIAMLYAGTSLHLSIRQPGTRAIASAVFIFGILLIIFAYLFTLNYWSLLGLAQG